jgi:hypothetical protein
MNLNALLNRLAPSRIGDGVTEFTLTLTPAEHEALVNQAYSFHADVDREIEQVRSLHKPINSLHEGYGLLAEEFTEFEDEVFLKESLRDPANARKELIQIAGVCRRIAEDLL